MARTLSGLIVSTLLLWTLGASATPNPVCSTGVYKTLLPLIGNDPKVQQFCTNLPRSNRLSRAKSPKQLQSMAYTAIATFCGCVKDACIPPTCNSGGMLCPKAPCGSVCIDYLNDAKNCGKCNNKCSTGEVCQQGVCAAPRPMCSLPEFPCGASGCVNRDTDPKNCGGCGTTCTGVKTVCSGGNCVCPDSKTYCEVNSGYGLVDTCQDTQNDPQNCGGCAQACTDYFNRGLTGCARGTCCKPDDSPCDNEGDDSTCCSGYCGRFGSGPAHCM